MTPYQSEAVAAPQDPYAVWAAQTRRAYLAGRDAGRWRLALRLYDGVTPQQLCADVPGLRVPAVYGDGACWCTAEFTGADAPPWGALQAKALVALAEPGLWRPDQAPARLPASTSTSAAKAGREAPAARHGRPVVIGVIDGACGFAHRRFRFRAGDRHWRTRLAAYWDQQDCVVGSYWQTPADLGYGRELVVDRFEALLHEHLGAADNDDDDDDNEAQGRAERAVYRELGVELPRDADWTHGTHVLDTVGGWPRRPPGAPAAKGEGERPVPSADVEDAALVHVQLPEAALRDTSGRWTPALVLDGLRYIVARAGADAEIVVNLSLGSFAGPHDGSSMLEQAIDALVDELDGRLTVVVAAGNAGRPVNDGDGTVRHCHVETELAPVGRGGDATTLCLPIGEADATETFVELWLGDGGADGSGVPEVDVALVAPAPGPTTRAAPGAVAIWPGAGDMALAQVVNFSGRSGPGPRGDGAMALVAIGSTRDVAGWRAPLGTWRIVVRNRTQRLTSLRAWVERRDVPGELVGERPQYGFAACEGVVRRHTNTLGSLANGARTVVVAGADFQTPKDWQLATSSSRAALLPRGRSQATPPRGPAIAAACEFEAAGFLTGSTKTLKGTSMAAAWVTRVVAAELAARRRAKEGNKAPEALRAWVRDKLRDWLAAPAPAQRGKGAAPPPPSPYIVALPAG